MTLEQFRTEGVAKGGGKTSFSDGPLSTVDLFSVRSAENTAEEKKPAEIASTKVRKAL